MDLLTNGLQAMHASEAPASQTSKSHFELIQEQVEPGGCAQWWGCFEIADALELCVHATPTAQLRVEILNHHFMPLAITTANGASRQVAATLARGGVVYFRVHNVGGEPEQIELMLSRHRSLPVPPSARRGLLLDFFRGLRAAA